MRRRPSYRGPALLPVISPPSACPPDLSAPPLLGMAHSLPVLQFLSVGRVERVVALGGELVPGRQAFVGPTTEAATAQLRVRTFFLAPCGIDACGVYAQSPAEASLQRQLIDIADQVVVVVTGAAFRASAPARIAPLGRLTGLVTDRWPPAELASALRRVGVVPHVVSS